MLRLLGVRIENGGQGLTQCLQRFIELAADVFGRPKRLEQDLFVVLFFDVGGRRLISRMIDGQFPAYERVIPKGNDTHIEFERDRLTNAVKRVALLSNERSRAVKFLIDKGKVEVASSSPEVGEAKETLPVEYSGASLQICFNAQYVIDFLSAVATDVVSLDARLLELVTESGMHWASIRFSGLIREEAGAAPQAFEEVWNLQKPERGDAGWMLAGIQQVS